MGGPGSGRTPDLKRRERAAALRARGLSLRAIGRRMECHHARVAALLEAAGAPPVPLCCARCGATLCVPGRGHRPDPPPRCLACLAEDPGAAFPARLRSYRAAAGLTVRALAAQARMSDGTVGELEAGRREPSPATAGKLAKALGLKLGQLTAGW